MNEVANSTAYMWAIVIAVVFFIGAIISANLIDYKPRNPGTTQRRVWFWALCVTGVITGFIINFFIGQGIDVPSRQADYNVHAAIGAAIALGVYIVCGFILSKIFRNSKLGTWF